MFLDETWAATNMARRYGRAPRGQRVLDAVPHGHWRTTTVIAALRAEGVVAPLVLDGAIDGPAFLAYVGQFLAPALRPGDVVVMDNLGSHKVAECAKRSSRRPTAAHNASTVRAASDRSRALSLAKAISIGLRSGL